MVEDWRISKSDSGKNHQLKNEGRERMVMQNYEFPKAIRMDITT